MQSLPPPRYGEAAFGYAVMIPGPADGGWRAWLEDRALHRAPVDAHFRQAVEWCIGRGTIEKPATVLELGPGPETDLQMVLVSSRIAYTSADLVVPVGRRDIVDLSPTWNEGQRSLPWRSGTFECVLAREVMEHVDDIYRMVEEIHRVLRPGGRLWFSTPFIFPLHDYESGDYWRLSDKAWDFLLTRFGFGAREIHHERLLFRSWQYPVSVLGWADR